ncbi:hypothetical protein DYI22_09025 [Marinobacter lipolyticus]|nr:hypothetical protein [Marinobacter lipolyticus]
MNGVASGRPAVAGDVSRPTESAGADKARRERPDRAAGERKAEAANKGQMLDEAQLRELAELKARDREVRAHEAAHQAVGGQYAGAISYVYERGPDGAQYAVGGEVPIDVAPVQGDPQATIEKMRVVRAAAMAPAAQDRAVAAQAMQAMLQAQAEMSRELMSPEDGDSPGVMRQARDAYESVARMNEPEVIRSRSIMA